MDAVAPGGHRCPPPTPATDRLLTIEEVAELCRLPLETMRWYRHKRTGPPMFRIGHHVVCRDSDVWAWLDSIKEADPLAG